MFNERARPNVLRRKNMWESLVTSIQNAILQIKLDPWWEATALAGEVVFGGRFVLQWIVSEYKKKSYVPTAFWFMSIVGSIILLIYSIHIEKPVLILAFTINTLIYMRNIHLIFRHKKAET
jgi:lipid-A-disaccharide synthase-like uncharacterized protein